MTTIELNSSKYKAPEGWVSSHSLHICRTRMNLTPSQVEELTGITAEQIINWESSIGAPTLQDLETLAIYYRCPVGYFFMEHPPAQNIDSVNFRGLSKPKFETLSYESRLKIDEFLILADTLSDMVRASNIPINPNIPHASLVDDITDIVNSERDLFGFSETLRSKWQTPNEAFLFWKTAIEDKGVYIFSLGLVVNEIRGASKWDKDSPPVILVNKNDYESATGRTFTLLHEWAHLMLRETGVACDFIGDKEKVAIEHFANRFAAEMMVSNSELCDYLKTINLCRYKTHWGDNDIGAIKNYFKVSKDVIAIMLENIDLAPKGFYWTKRAQWDKRKPFYRNLSQIPHSKTKVVRRFEELGKPFSSLLANSYTNGNISLNKLSKMLDIKIEKLNDFVNYVKIADY